MNTLKILHAADFHLDSDFSSLSPEAAQTRRAEARELLPRLAEAAQIRGADALILSGDIFENGTPSPETKRALCRALGGLDMPVLIACGNHDPYYPGCVWDTMELPENVQLFTKAKISCAEYPELNARFWGAGFEKAFCPPLLQDFEAPEKIDGVFDVMVLHGDLGAAESDYCPVKVSELAASGMDYVALGHIHLRSDLALAGKTAYAYPGAPEGRGFDELGERGCYLITLSESGVSAEFVPLNSRRYEILSIDLSAKDPLEALEAALAEFTDKDHVRVILSGETERALDLAALRRDLRAELSELQLRDNSHIKTDVWAGLERDDLAGLFLRKLDAQRKAASNPAELQKIELAAAFGITTLNGGKLL